MQMTYRKAIIILDRLVTTERIEVDREELREAVKVAQKALNIVADLKKAVYWFAAAVLSVTITF